MKQTKAVEDYLESIYLLTKLNGYTRVRDIARFLNVKLPSVTEIIKKLQEEGFVEHTPYGEIKLTEEGRRIGLETWNKHKILYVFLKDYLDVEDETAFKEACLIEHTVSEETVEKLRKFLEELKNR